MPPDAPAFEYLASAQTPIGLICLRRRTHAGDPATAVTEVTLDHAFLMSSAVTVSERALASRALGHHAGHDLDVLVGGLGLGYTAAAALASDRVRTVEVVEFLPAVLDWWREGLVPLAATLTADARLTLAQGDVYARLAAPPARTHDLILIDVDHAPDAPLEVSGAASAAFYTVAGLEAARAHLAADGWLGIWSTSESPRLVEALAAVFAEVRVEPVPVSNPVVGEDYVDWLFFARR